MGGPIHGRKLFHPYKWSCFTLFTTSCLRPDFSAEQQMTEVQLRRVGRQSQATLTWVQWASQLRSVLTGNASAKLEVNGELMVEETTHPRKLP